MLCQWFRVTKTKVSTKKKAGDHQKVGQLQKWVIITMFMRSKAYVLIWFLGDFILPMVNSILVSYFVSYPCIVSLYRILSVLYVSYPCIVSFMYKYVLRSHRIVGYQYTYKIHKIYNFSGIQLNTHLRIQSGIFEHEYTSRIRRIKHVFLNTIGYKQDTNSIRMYIL